MQQRTREELDGALAALNHILRHLWETFRECGGDFTDPKQVDDFARVVENRKLTLPSRRRWAFDLVLRTPGEYPYAEIVAALRRRGIHVSEQTLRRQAWRAAKDIEAAIRARRWGRAAAQPDGGSAPPPRTRGDV